MDIFTRKGRGRPRKTMVDAVPIDKTAKHVADNDGFGQTSGCGTTSSENDGGESARLAEIARKRREVMRRVDLLNMNL